MARFKTGMFALWVALASGNAQAEKRADFAAHTASADARYMAQWVLDSRDHREQPFAIVDKKDARLYLFNAAGRLLGASPALLGSASGDESAPGVGLLLPALIPSAQRTTPAGRFATEPGHNNHGEDIVWFDYDAALAIHRLRPAPRQQQRPARLQSSTPDDNRISLGCIVVPVAFYEQVVAPLLGRQRGVIYVLPETQATQALFGSQVRLAALKP